MTAALPPVLVLGGAELAAAFRTGIHQLISRAELINRINVFPVPDGDTGTNLALTLQAVLVALGSAPDTHAGRTLTRIADAALDGARGNSGAILAQFLTGVADHAGHLAEIDGQAFAGAVTAGAAYARESLTEPREGTILSVLSDFASATSQAALRGERDLRALFRDTLAAARRSLEATRDQLEVLRRANVVGFFWPTALQDATALVARCEACQFHSKKLHQPAQALQTIPLSWPFSV
jgi:dihydroxyacetone kinase-like predicted kinase